MSNNNNQSPQSPVPDFFQHLLNNPIPASSSSSSAAQTSNPSPPPTGFAAFQNSLSNFTVNPYSQQFYHQTGFSPVAPQFLNRPLFPQQWQPQWQPQFEQPSPHQSQPQTPNSPPAVEVEAEDEAVFDPRNKNKRKQIRWTENDTKILAERWVGASENPTVGNSQSEEAFWRTIGTAFNSLVDTKRNKNQLTGKWNKIRGDTKIFGGIFKRYAEGNRQSGSDEKAVYDAAHQHFIQQTGRKFIYESCWHVLKDYPKFWNDFGVGSHKRQWEEPIHLDEDEPTADPTPDTDPNPRMTALFGDDPIRRPPQGRNASRKSQRSSSSSDATSSRISEESKEALLEVQETARRQRQTLMTIEETQRQKQVFEAFRLLQTPIPDGLPKKERKKMEKFRAKLWQKYVAEFGADEDSDDSDE